jgi:ribonuclease III
MGSLHQKVHLQAVYAKLGYTFQQPVLLEQAMRHSSYVNEQDDPDLSDNERLEFLGDAVLDLAVSHFLMERYPGAQEGVLSKYRAMIVDEAGLCEVAVTLGLGEHLLLGRGEEQSNGRSKPSILADTMEALIGALYLDAGFDQAMGVIRRWFQSLLDKVTAADTVYDFKSALQEYAQRVYKELPRYRLVEETGPAHDKTFRVALHLRGETLSEAEGKSKKEAEQRAAHEALLWLKKE